MDKLDFVCFSVNNWEKRKARKQQFMLHLSLRDDVGRVLYVEPALNLWRLILLPWAELNSRENRIRWKRALLLWVTPSVESGKLFIFTPLFIIPFSYRCYWLYKINLYILAVIIKAKLRHNGFQNIVLWVYHPFDYPLLCWFSDAVLSVFDWAEEWAEYFIEYGRRQKMRLRFLEEQMIKDADLVFIVSDVLLKQALAFNPNSYHILDGTVHEIFQPSAEEPPVDMARIKRPIAGYLGSVSERMDTELLEYVSKRYPDVSFVCIGDIHYQRVVLGNLQHCANVYFLGLKPYEELGKYALFFDICILPYKPLSSTYISPTKIFDYLATGKPIVSIALACLNNFSGVLYAAHTKEEFADLFGKALQEDNAQLRQKRKDIARQNTWEQRAEEIMNIAQQRMRYG